jgi:hypothetical protein
MNSTRSSLNSCLRTKKTRSSHPVPPKRKIERQSFRRDRRRSVVDCEQWWSECGQRESILTWKSLQDYFQLQNEYVLSRIEKRSPCRVSAVIVSLLESSLLLELHLWLWLFGSVTISSFLPILSQSFFLSRGERYAYIQF